MFGAARGDDAPPVIARSGAASSATSTPSMSTPYPVNRSSRCVACSARRGDAEHGIYRAVDRPACRRGRLAVQKSGEFTDRTHQWRRKNDGRVLFDAEFGERLQVAQLQGKRVFHHRIGGVAEARGG